MTAPLGLGVFAAGLAVAFAAAFGLGSVVGPVVDEQPAHAADDAGHAEDGGDETPAALPGLAVSDAGWTLRLADPSVSAGPAVPVRFTVVGPDGSPETSYTSSHTKDLHLVVVRRDLSGFQHVHPELATDGTWSAPLDLRAPGTYRVFADFVPRELGRQLTLGADLAVAGDFAPATLPAPPATADAGDGYSVSVSGRPVAGRESELVFSVARDGRPVRALQPYLGAAGHLVALRAGDLAYLHTHALDEAGAGPDVAFATTFPTAGSYRLYLDFRVDGTVRTAAFTVEVAP